jgi:hypothetical protein
MAVYRYPQNNFDTPELLLDLLGSFWANTYQGTALVGDLTSTAGQIAQQTYLHLLELINSVSRFDVPVYHQDNWYGLTIRESELNTDPSLLPQHTTPSSYQFLSDATLSYSTDPQTVRQSLQLFVVTKPTGLENVKLIFNKLTSPTVELQNGLDYWITDSVIVFRDNPFNNPLIARRDLLNNSGQIVDRELVLWLYRGLWDWNTVYEQFGYALQLQLKSSEGYKSFLNAIFDALVEGTSLRTQQFALAAVYGVPLIIEATETVETIAKDADKLNIITDSHAYQFPVTAIPLVQVGDVVRAGDSITNLLQVFELNRGAEISPADIQALTIGTGVLAWGFWGDLTFENKQVPVIVESDTAGLTKVSWALGGFPFDVENFWDEVHTAGVQKGQTLANLLDTRENPVGQPTAGMLPTTINPFQFLTNNLLRNNAYLVKVRPGSELTDRLDFMPVEQLRKIQPPHTLMLLIVELVHRDSPVIMENPGTETDPGYVETLSGFPCMVNSDDMDPAVYVAERVRTSVIGGRCV